MKYATTLLLLSATIVCLSVSGWAAETPTAAPAPSVEQRIADLEAYVTNGARQGDVPTALTTSPGPGHNAWQMACAALVLLDRKSVV